MNDKQKPSIRFKGFTEAWEQRKAKNLFVSTADKGHPELPVLSATQDRGMIRRDENSINIYHDKKNEEGYKRVLPGQFVIHLRSFQGGFAHSAIEGITSPAYTVFGFSEPEKHNPNYWKYVFTSKEFIRRLETVTYGIRDGRSISYDEFLTMDFVYPMQDEQTKIANYLDTLDNLITLHQCKCNYLIRLKHWIFYLLNKTDWEQRKVLDLLELLTDYDANGSFADMAKNINTTDGDGYAWYVRITDLENPKPLSELKYVDESSYEFLKKTELHGGELLMAKRGNIGKVYIFEPRTKYATVAPNMYLLKLNNKVIPHFLYDYFVSEEGNKKLTRLNASSTMGALYKDDVKNIDVIMPSIEEQAMIGNFFQSIDHIITLHQRKPFCINRRQKWKQTIKMRNCSANIMQNGFQYIRKGR